MIKKQTQTKYMTNIKDDFIDYNQTFKMTEKICLILVTRHYYINPEAFDKIINIIIKVIIVIIKLFYKWY